MSKIALTGGAGFIGSHVADRILSQGHELLVIDNLSTGREENLASHKDNSSLHFLKSDIQSSRVRDEIRSFCPDVMVHLAAQMNVRKSVAEPVYDAEQNILGTINLLQASEEVSLKKFVFSSTGGAIYGEQDSFPADESHGTRPECPYGLSKRAAELYIEYYARKCVMPSYSLRFGNVYGPRQNPHGEAGVVSIFIEQLLAGKPLTVNGDGSQTRDFIYVRDIVDAVFAIIDHPQSAQSEQLYQVFNLGTGIESSVTDIVAILFKITGDLLPDMTPEVTYRPQPEGEQMRSLLDASLFSRAFNWTPGVTLTEGLHRTFEETKTRFS
jgi:UDP-glucose 4-epimerase